MQVDQIETLVQKVTDELMKRLALANTDQVLSPLPVVPVTDPSGFSQLQELTIKKLTVPQLAASANLLATDEVTMQIQTCLLQGKPVYVEEIADTCGSGERKYAVEQKIADLKRQCQRFGMHFGQPAVTPVTRSFTNAGPTTGNSTSTKRKFITEKELAEMVRQGDLTLPAGSRLTPLAKDYARLHGFTE